MWNSAPSSSFLLSLGCVTAVIGCLSVFNIFTPVGKHTLTRGHMHMLVWFLIKLLNASHLRHKDVVLNHLLINENLFNVFLQDILEMQSCLHKYLVFSPSLHCVFVPFATVIALLWVMPVLWMAWQASCTPRTRSCTIWSESSVFTQRWSAPSVRWLKATKKAMFISCPIWCVNPGNIGFIVAYALIYFYKSKSKVAFLLLFRSLAVKAEETFYDIVLAATLRALCVQPGLTGSCSVCDELAAYLRARGNKHGVAGQD